MLWIGAFLLTYYLLTLGGHQYSIDGILDFQSAKSIVFRHSLVLDPPVRWGEDMRRSFRGIGLPLAYVPALLLMLPVFAWRPAFQAIPYDPGVLRNPQLYANLPYLLCSWVNPALTAATGCLVFRIGRMLGLPRPWALGAALAFGVASPAATYARYDFNQPLATFLLATAVYALLRAADGARGAVALAGAALGCAVLTRPELGALAAVAAAWVWCAGADRGVVPGLRRVAVLALPILAAVAIGLSVNHTVSPKAVLERSASVSTMFALTPTSILIATGGLIISPVRGILVFAPLAWLAVPGLFRLARTRPGPAVLLAAIVGTLGTVYAAYGAWWGGLWAWGPRFLVPCLPFLALGAAAWAADGGRGRRAVFVALAGVGVIVSWNGVLFDPLDFGRWLVTDPGFRDNAAAQFRVVASPIITGWFEPRDRSFDLLWLRAIDGEQLRRHGGLLGEGVGGRPEWLALARVTTAIVVAALLAGLAVSGRKLVRLSRSCDAPHP